MSLGFQPDRQSYQATIAALRPRLHRYCARMCGSVFDGEDVVQETLADAFARIDTLRDPSRLEPWLFRIAHHKCVDFLRRERRWREETVTLSEDHEGAVDPDISSEKDDAVGEALVALVGTLPPKERASVLLKDVLDFHIGEIADIIESTVGGVKAALHRGREKLRTAREPRTPSQLDRRENELLEAYSDCFNRHDWSALRALIRVDARLEVVGAAAGTMLDVGRNYFTNYLSLPYEWRITVERVEGETVLVHWKREGEWTPVTAVKLWWEDGVVQRIRDYVHVDYLLRDVGLK